jgi:hypothetical protein
MRKLLIFLVIGLPLPGCALPSWAVPWNQRPAATSDRSRQAQQAAFDRSARRWGVNASNGLRTSDYIPGTATRPF